MNRINWMFSNRFRSHWIKVKFYKEKPELVETKIPEKIRFCEATKDAILRPILLSKDNVDCPGAQYAFGWNRSNEGKNKILDICQNKRGMQKDKLNIMLEHSPYFENPYKFIGLNTEGEPDILMSYISPEEAMNLLNIYNSYQGEDMDISLSGMMPICGGVAVKTFLDEKVNFSFGCSDSRKYAQIGRDRLAVGIPKKLFKIFVLPEAAAISTEDLKVASEVMV